MTNAAVEESEMGKIIVTAWVTLDGFVAGPADEMDWLLVDEEMAQYEQGLVDDASALLLGRITHSDFANAWPAIAADPSEPDANRRYARRLCALEKLAVSARGEITPWERTTRVPALDPDVIARFKAEQAGNIVVYGSLSIVATLTNYGAVDEYHLLVHPTLLGTGKPLHPGRLDLNHLTTETFASGVVCNRYTTAEGAR